MKSTSKLIIFIITLLALAASAHAQSPREQLKQMVQQLQKTPDDNALREKIIKLAQGVKPRPAIPEEANRAFVKGNVFQKEAKDASGYDFAITAYRDALRVAPWWGDAYFNQAVALEAAGKFDEAIASIKLYMISILGASTEAREAQNRIYAIEAKSEMASRLAIVQAAAERERQRPSVEGRWTNGMWNFQVTKSGEKFDLIPLGFVPGISGQWQATGIELDRKRVKFNWLNPSLNCPECKMLRLNLSLSENGNELTGTSTREDLGKIYPITCTRMP
ncbi:MAG: hypothetical protein NUV55_03055 [Sulfuricaulis sp.]|uniref:tetratricopeptide repeat protein n=1 Tax=Sulfuricaulis sp. TaxID=2003553 RepID=UPI0025F44DF7|nr:tetratricopeptide repeat protein [Sulfuricaulis sp.]MCR4346174.1 hypothetical protein [Sulfuricaulis sp.]